MHMLVFALLFEHHAIPCTPCFPCADPGFFVRGGEGPGQSDKKALTTFFFQSSAYFTEVKWLISKKTIIFHGSRGGPTFSRGGPTFSRGFNCLYPIETHITCDFPGGSGPPDPLWIRTCYLDQQKIAFFRLVVVGWYFSVLFKF